MISGINSALQSVAQSAQQPAAMREDVKPQAPAGQAAPSTTPAAQVSLQQTAQTPADKAMADYRALGQKATLAMEKSQDASAQQQQQTQMRNQAYLATAALKSGG